MALGDIFAIRNGPNTFDGEQKGNFLGLGPHYDLGAFATVAEVIAAIGQDDASIGLTPRVTRVLAGDTEFGANILFRPTGGILNVNGHLLVVMEMADPGPIQVFDVSVAGSEVVFSPHIKVRPEWFAAAGDAKVGSGSVVQGNAVVSINGDNPFTQADIGKTVHVGIVHRLIIISTDGSDFATLHRTSPIGVEHVDAYVDGVLRSNDARVFEGSNALFAVGGAWTVADEDKVVTFHKSITAVLTDVIEGPGGSVQLSVVPTWTGTEAMLLIGTDDTTAWQAAVDSTLGVGTVVGQPVRYLANIEISGAMGLVCETGRTILTSVPGSNKDVIRSKNFDLWTETPKPVGTETRGDNYTMIKNIIADGGSAFNTLGYGWRVWGRAQFWERLAAINCPQDGFYTEYSTHFDPLGKPFPLVDSVNAMFFFIQSFNNGGDGWTFRGPHDAEIFRYEGVNNAGISMRTEVRDDGSVYYNGQFHLGIGFDSWQNLKGSWYFGAGHTLYGVTASGPGGPGFEFAPGIGNMRAFGCICGGHDIGAILRGIDHHFECQFLNIEEDVLVIDGLGNSQVDVEASSYLNGVRIISESTPNTIRFRGRSNSALNQLLPAAGPNPLDEAVLVQTGVRNESWIQSPQSSGVRFDRPPMVAGWNIGRRYFDITLGREIYWNGTDWVDSTGTLVDRVALGAATFTRASVATISEDV